MLGHDLAGLDVGLIEGVDADDRAGDRCCDLPAEKFLAEAVGVGDGDADYGLSGFFDGGDLGVLRGVGCALKRR